MRQLFGNTAEPSQSPSQSDMRIEQLKAGVSNPVFIAAAVVGTAICAQQLYRFLRPKHRRPQWKSRSRRPQISRWENEGGDVPQVEALRSRTQH